MRISHRRWSVALALLVLATGCAGGDDSGPAASGCVDHEVLDRHGEVHVVEVCGPGAAPDASSGTAAADDGFGARTDTAFARVRATVTDPTARRALDALRAALGSAREVCGDPDAWRAEVDAVVDTLDAVRPHAVTLHTDLGTMIELSDEVAAEVLLAGDCDGRWALERAPAPVATVIDAQDRFAASMLLLEDGARGSTLWTFEELRTLMLLSRMRGAAAEPDVVVVGSSVAVEGVDEVLLEQATGRPALNAGLAGNPPDVVPSWLAELELDEGRDLVWVLSPAQLVRCIQPGSQFADRATLRADAFSAVIPDPDDVGSPDKLVAHLGSGAHDNPVLSFVGETYDPTLRRRVANRDLAEPEVVADTYLEVMREGSPCEERNSVVVETVGELTTRHDRVLVAFTPVLDAIEAAYPGGGAALDEVVRSTAEALIGAGAEVLDLTDLDDATLRDPVHANLEGRAQVTAAIADALGTSPTR